MTQSLVQKLAALSKRVADRPARISVARDVEDPLITDAASLFDDGSEDDSSRPPFTTEKLINDVLWAEGDELPGFVRPSMIGGCKRANFFHFTQAPEGRQKHDPKMARVLATGNVYHRLVQEWLGNSHEIYFCPESPAWDRELAVRGKCDGILITRDLKFKWMLEIKTISSSGFEKLSKAIPKHVKQAHTYAALHDCKWIDFLYVCKNNQDFRNFQVKFNPKVWEEIKQQLSNTKEYAKRKVPPKFDAKECDPSFCKFTKHCFKLKDIEDARAAASRS